MLMQHHMNIERKLVNTRLFLHMTVLDRLETVFELLTAVAKATIRSVIDILSEDGRIMFLFCFIASNINVFYSIHSWMLFCVLSILSFV